MQSDTKDFCVELVQHGEDLGRLLQEHLDSYDELLPHVFLGDITRYILADGLQRHVLVLILNEALLKGPADVQNLIAVSFIENLKGENDLECALQGIQADALREEWYRQHQ